MEIDALRKFDRKVRRMRSASSLPRDPRFNAFHWISDCWFMSYQIEYSCHKVQEAAKEYRANNQPGDNPSNAIPKLSYYADNAIIRLMSFSDKLGLCLYSFFEDFDPNGTQSLLALSDIVNRLRFGSVKRKKGTSRAVSILEPVLSRRPRVLKQYRDAKIHRREPRIEYYGVQSHHDAGYVVKAETEEEIQQLRGRIAAIYSGREMQRDMLESCKIDGTYYRVTDASENRRLFSYQQVNKALKDYRRVCYGAASDAASFLSRRKPFSGRP